jgi:hypothetical protein
MRCPEVLTVISLLLYFSVLQHSRSALARMPRGHIFFESRP